MDPHRVKVFDRADDDAVVVLIAHHLHLILFPANQGFVNQQLVGRRQVQPTLADLFKLFAVVSDAAAGAAHGEGGADNAREADISGHRQRLFHGMRDTGTRGVEADFLHRHVETAAIFRFINRVGGGANHRHAELFQHSLALQLQRTVQRRLAAHGRQYRVRTLFFDDFAYHFPLNRLDVGRIGHLRVGHNRCRVGVDEDYAIALFTQRLTRLRAGVVKLTRLADNNRARAQNQDTFYICTFWHSLNTPDYLAVLRYCSISSMKWSNRGAASCGPGLASGCPWKLKAGLSVR